MSREQISIDASKLKYGIYDLEKKRRLAFSDKNYRESWQFKDKETMNRIRYGLSIDISHYVKIKLNEEDISAQEYLFIVNTGILQDIHQICVEDDRILWEYCWDGGNINIYHKNNFKDVIEEVMTWIETYYGTRDVLIYKIDKYPAYLVKLEEYIEYIKKNNELIENEEVME